MEKLFVCLEKDVFQGNVLDITYDNMNIIYNANKYFDRHIEPNYLEPNCGRGEGGIYDSCVLFFSLNMLKTMREKEALLADICDKLCSGGYMYLWDVSENRGRMNVIVSLPDKTVEFFTINCNNLIQGNRLENIEPLVLKYFNIEHEVKGDKAYKLICRKRMPLSSNKN